MSTVLSAARSAAPAIGEVVPVGGHLGAELRGADLRAVDDDAAAALHGALARHKVLFARGQHLTPTELVALGRRLGPLTAAHPVLPPLDAEHPEVLEIDATRSRQDPRYRDEWENDTWHTDVSFLPDPPLGSILSGVVIPERGGDTAFADLQAAYDSLSAPVRRLVDELDAEHDGRAEFAAFLADHPEGGTWAGRRFTVLEPVRHPVVRAHPVTARPGLFVNPTFTTRLLGVSRAESQALLEMLHQHTTRPEHVFRHRWEAGDVVLWDNRATLHVGIRDYGDAHRVLHRVTLEGGVPYRPVRVRR
jgi:taurine dioxygenase